MGSQEAELTAIFQVFGRGSRNWPSSLSLRFCMAKLQDEQKSPSSFFRFCRDFSSEQAPFSPTLALLATFLFRLPVPTSRKPHIPHLFHLLNHPRGGCAITRCKIRLGNKPGGGLKCGINEVSSTVSKELWRQRGCSDIWNDQPFTF